MEKIKNWIKSIWRSITLEGNPMPTAHFTIYEGKGGAKRWRLVSDDGENLANSTGSSDIDISDKFFHNLSIALQNAPIVRPEKNRFEITRGTNGLFYWRLVNIRKKHNDYIAVGGQGFETERDAIKDIERFKRYGIDAVIIKEKECDNGVRRQTKRPK